MTVRQKLHYYETAQLLLVNEIWYFVCFLAILATFRLFLAYLLLLEGVVVSLVNCCVLLVALRLALNLESITSRILNLEGSTRPVNEPTFNLVPLRLTVWSWYLC